MLWWTDVLPRHTRGGPSLANCAEQCSCQVRRHGDGLPAGEPLGQEPVRKGAPTGEPDVIEVVMGGHSGPQPASSELLRRSRPTTLYRVFYPSLSLSFLRRGGQLLRAHARCALRPHCHPTPRRLPIHDQSVCRLPYRQMVLPRRGLPLPRARRGATHCAHRCRRRVPSTMPRRPPMPRGERDADAMQPGPVPGRARADGLQGVRGAASNASNALRRLSLSCPAHSPRRSITTIESTYTAIDQRTD